MSRSVKWSQKKLNELERLYGRECFYCGAKETKDVFMTVEHLIPRSRGGSNDIENLRFACASCNSSRFNRSYDSWALLIFDDYLRAEKRLARCKKILETLAKRGLI